MPCSTSAQCIVSYNVENLFHPGVSETYGVTKYYTKLNHIAKVIACCNGFELPDIVGLSEVENDSVLDDLCRQFGTKPYRYIHYDSPDRRGIDVALLYRSKYWHVEHARPVAVYLDSVSPTRDLLYVCMTRIRHTSHHPADTLHIIQCHLPSQLGGTSASEWKRLKAHTVIHHIVDSVLITSQTAQIVVMGDFNASKVSDIGLCYLAPSNANSEVSGTHKYHGRWAMLDHAYVSTNLVPRTECTIWDADFLLEEDKKYGGVKPYRTNVFYGARDGYSDHLPIIIRIAPASAQ